MCVLSNLLGWEVGLGGMCLLDGLGEGVRHVLHDQVEEGALLLLHEEGVVQTDHVVMLQLLEYFQLTVLVLFVLQHMLHRE